MRYSTLSIPSMMTPIPSHLTLPNLCVKKTSEIDMRTSRVHSTRARLSYQKPNPASHQVRSLLSTVVAESTASSATNGEDEKQSTCPKVHRTTIDLANGCQHHAGNGRRARQLDPEVGGQKTRNLSLYASKVVPRRGIESMAVSIRRFGYLLCQFGWIKGDYYIRR